MFRKNRVLIFILSSSLDLNIFDILRYMYFVITKAPMKQCEFLKFFGGLKNHLSTS